MVQFVNQLILNMHGKDNTFPNVIANYIEWMLKLINPIKFWIQYVSRFFITSPMGLATCNGSPLLL